MTHTMNHTMTHAMTHAIYTTRYPFWMDWHKRANIAGLMLMLVAMVLLIVWKVQTGRQLELIASAHGYLGIVLILICALQIVWGYKRPDKPGEGEDKTSMRRAFEILHRVGATAMVAIAITTVILGSKRMGYHGTSTEVVSRTVTAMAVWCAMLVAVPIMVAQIAKGDDSGGGGDAGSVSHSPAPTSPKTPQYEVDSNHNMVEESSTDYTPPASPSAVDVSPPAQPPTLTPQGERTRIGFYAKVALFVSTLVLIALVVWCCAVPVDVRFQSPSIDSGDAFASSGSALPRIQQFCLDGAKLPEKSDDATTPTPATTQTAAAAAADGGGDGDGEDAEIDGNDDVSGGVVPIRCFPSYFSNDGWCDAHAPYNTEACGFDGGDCCDTAAPFYDCKDPSSPYVNQSSPKGQFSPPRSPRYVVEERAPSTELVVTTYVTTISIHPVFVFVLFTRGH